MDVVRLDAVPITSTLLARRTHEGDLRDATSDECRMLLIALVRQARFCDGAVDEALTTTTTTVTVQEGHR